MYCKEHGVTVEFCDRCFCEGKKNSVSIIFAGKMKLERVTRPSRSSVLFVS